VNRSATGLKRQIGELSASFKRRPKTPENVSSALKALEEKVDAVASLMTRQAPMGFAGAPLSDEPEPLLNRVRGLYFVLNQMTAPPTPQHRDAMPRLAKQIDEVAAKMNAIVETDVPAFNKLLFDSGIGRLDAGRKIQ